MSIAVNVPSILRGKGRDSGSATLIVGIAMQTPGTDVLCSAPKDRLVEMGDEVLHVMARTPGAPEAAQLVGRPLTRIMLNNGSRILFREPRRDGAGALGIYPTVIWLDEVEKWAEHEAFEMVKRGWGTGLLLEDRS